MASRPSRRRPSPLCACGKTRAPPSPHHTGCASRGHSSTRATTVEVLPTGCALGAAGAPTADANRNQTKTKLRTGSTGVRRTSSSWAATRFPRKNGTLAYVPVGGRRDWQRRHGWQSVVEQGTCPLDLWWAVEKAEGAAASGTRRRETSRENGGGSAPRSADLLHTAHQVRFPQTDRRVAVVPTDQLQLPRRGGHRQMGGGG